MSPRRYTPYLLLILALGLLPGGMPGARAQVDTLRMRFYLRPYTRQTDDSMYHERVRQRCWLLRYTRRDYQDQGNGRLTLASKTRSTWFFGRVTRKVYYHSDYTRFVVRHYRRHRPPRYYRVPGSRPDEYLTVERHFNGHLRARSCATATGTSWSSAATWASTGFSGSSTGPGPGPGAQSGE